MENIYNTQINNMDASNSINKQTRGGTIIMVSMRYALFAV